MTFCLNLLIVTVINFPPLLIVYVTIVSGYLCLTCCMKHMKSITARNDAQQDGPAACRSYKYYQTKDKSIKVTRNTIAQLFITVFEKKCEHKSLNKPWMSTIKMRRKAFVLHFLAARVTLLQKNHFALSKKQLTHNRCCLNPYWLPSVDCCWLNICLYITDCN